MSKRTIKVGDKIKVTDALSVSGYKNGDVMTVTTVYGDGDVDATFGELDECYFLYASEYELITEPAEKVINFEDIRKGDRIQVTLNDDDLVLTGVASYPSEGWWYTPKGHLLAFSRSVAVITLLDRPKPELPTEPGSVIIATEVRGVKGRWVMMRLDGSYGWVAESDDIGGYLWHGTQHITEWEPAKIVPVGAK